MQEAGSATFKRDGSQFTKFAMSAILTLRHGIVVSLLVAGLCPLSAQLPADEVAHPQPEIRTTIAFDELAEDPQLRDLLAATLGTASAGRRSPS